MSFVKAQGGLYLPAPLAWNDSATPGFTTMVNITSTNADDYGAWIFRAPKDGTLDHFECYLTVSTPRDLTFSFRNVLSTGYPSTTIDQFFTIVQASLATGWQTAGVMTDDGTGGGVKRTVSRGDLFACVVMFSASGGNLTVRVAGHEQNPNFPYTACFNATKTARANTVAVLYDDGSVAEMVGLVYPWLNFGSSSLNTGTTPDEVGNIFQVPFPCKVDGAWMKTEGGNDCQAVLYDADGSTVLTQSPTSTNGYRVTSSPLPFYWPFEDEVELAADTPYRLVLKPTTASSVGAYYFDVDRQLLFDAIDLGQDCHATERTDGGSWSQTTTRRYFMGVRVSEIGADAGGGGGSMSYGFVG